MRTLVLKLKTSRLISTVLYRGGGIDNAIVIYDEPVGQENIDRLCDLMRVQRMKVKANRLHKFRSPQVGLHKPARHSLWMIGDACLSGRPIKGRVVAVRPGHTINSKSSRRWFAGKCATLRSSRLTITPNNEPIIDVNGIRKLLPHRYPFLLIDKVIEIDKKHCVAVKNVTVSEPFFVGHFRRSRSCPVCSGGGYGTGSRVLVLNYLEDPEKYSTYFLQD